MPKSSLSQKQNKPKAQLRAVEAPGDPFGLPPLPDEAPVPPPATDAPLPAGSGKGR